MRYDSILLLTICMLQYYRGISQCIPPVPSSNSTCGTGIPLQDGANINTGETHYFDGVGGSFSNISLAGGTLVLCGSATITNVNFNSGSIEVRPGANIVFNGNFNVGANLRFYNAGNVTFNQNISVQGTNNFIFNDAGASITVNGSLTVFNDGLFVNNGLAVGDAITLNSGANICFGPQGVANVTSIHNDAINPLTISSGTACFKYTTTMTGNAPITSDPDLVICQDPAASAPAPAVIGAATVLSNCSACPLTAIPLTLISFKGTISNRQVELEWETVFEENVKSFIIEKSINRLNFETIGEVAANNRPSVYRFNADIRVNSFFRLKMLDIDGKFTYSPIVFVKTNEGDFQLLILSNPVTKNYVELAISVPSVQRGEVLIIDHTGKTLKRTPVMLSKGNNNIIIDLAGISRGQYFICLKGIEKEIKALPFIRL